MRPHPTPRHRRSLATTVLVLSLLAGCGEAKAGAPGSASSPAAAPPAQSASSAAATTAAPVPATAAGPAPVPAIPTSGPVDQTLPRSGTGVIDVTRYDLTLDYGMGTTGILSGTARLTLTPRADAASFPLDLRGLRVTRASVAGAPATVTAGPARIVITPRTPLRTGTSVNVVVEYSGRPVTYRDESGAECGFVVHRTGVAVVNQPNCAGTWFPVNDAPWDKAVFRITTSVPQRWTVAGNGTLTQERRQGGKATFTWESGDPMAPYLATASIGRFRFERSTSPSGVPILHAVDPALPASSTAVLRRTGEVLTFLEARLGPYPLVSAGAIMSKADVDYELETQTRVYLGAASSTSTLLHELAHQWWGNAVTPRSWSDLWINEGMCALLEWEWGAAQGGPSIDAQARALLQRPAGSAFWKTRLTAPGAENLFSEAIYLRSAAFFVTLRQELGPQRFEQLRKRWVSEHRGGTGSTEQLQALATQIAGKDMGPLFDTWVRSSAKPRR